jgi:hypothetical protein
MKMEQQHKTVFRELIPNAARTMAALREVGYDSYHAVMDLIDNSIDAGATVVDVTVKQTGKSMTIDITDDGKGMDEKTLEEALRLGSDTKHNDKKDLGKFGMGLKTASISIARKLWVLTRQEKKQAFEGTLDLDVIDKHDKFYVTIKPAESKRVVGLVGDRGTLVKLERIDRVSDSNATRFSQKLRERVCRVFRHPIKSGLKLTINGRKVEAEDPLMLAHKDTEIIFDQAIDLHDGTRAKVTVVELPDLGTQGDAEAGIVPHHSGFYVVRNGREIIAHETFGFYRHHHSYSHFRAEISYKGNSTAFHEDIKKGSIHPDPRVLDKLKQITEKLIARSGQRGRERGETAPLDLSVKGVEEAINTKLGRLVRPAAEPAKGKGDKGKDGDKPEAKAGTNGHTNGLRVKFEEQAVEAGGRFYHADRKGDEFTIWYNSKHPLVRLVSDMKQRQSQFLMGCFAFAMAQAEQEMPELAKLKVGERIGDLLAEIAAPEKS